MSAIEMVGPVVEIADSAAGKTVFVDGVVGSVAGIAGNAVGVANSAV